MQMSILFMKLNEVQDMAIITVICSGMMGSAITFPAAQNGHTIRLVGSPLDKDIIEHGKKTGEHLTLSLYRKNNDTIGTDEPFVMPGAVSFHYIEEMEKCIKDADLIICGVSSFGLDWFCENVIPKLPESTPLLSISKGMIDDGENKYYVTGDTLYNEEIFSDLPSDIYTVFLPVNGVGNNMNMHDAKNFCERINPKWAVPVHCGMFDSIDMNEFQFENKIIPKIYEEVKLK